MCDKKGKMYLRKDVAAFRAVNRPLLMKAYVRPREERDELRRVEARAREMKEEETECGNALGALRLGTLGQWMTGRLLLKITTLMMDWFHPRQNSIGYSNPTIHKACITSATSSLLIQLHHERS